MWGVIRPGSGYGEGQEVALYGGRGQQVIDWAVGSKGWVWVDRMGLWKRGCAEPLWMPGGGLGIYLQRMKIEETFRGLKSRLGLGCRMNEFWGHRGKRGALLLLVYAIGRLVGERLRDFLYGALRGEGEPASAGEDPDGSGWKGEWTCYSGLFVLLKQRWSVSLREWRAIVGAARAAFQALLFPPVPTLV